MTPGVYSRDEVESNQGCVGKLYQGSALMRMNFKQAGRGGEKKKKTEPRVKKPSARGRAAVLNSANQLENGPKYAAAAARLPGTFARVSD